MMVAYATMKWACRQIIIYFFFLTYTKILVDNFLVLQKQFVTPKSIIQEKPLAPTARRAGWIGCNIDLSQVPAQREDISCAKWTS